ncbi:MAG: Re/Si-specific NAD(P)(+) transhydrogenase subunit alpha [Deltaproteobacteria bacterium]|nr:Re/Si-specific NAD(P)(+) transhydrogenase subunit alpha [Deltaproteobacteria bacterium]
MIIAVTKETQTGEKRVALVPDVVAKLVKQGLKIQIEAGAGASAFFSDAAYQKAGAEVLTDRATILKNADILVKLNPLEEAMSLRAGSVAIGLLNPTQNVEAIKKLAEKKITAFAMEKIPRISRAQSMDVLSSQASIAGYKAVLLAASKLPKFFPMMTTAAGTVTPAKVFIMGVGVAGLQAIATARRLGAVVEAFDIRPQTKQEVESLGAKFVEIKLEEQTVGAQGYAKEVSEETKKKIQDIVTRHVAQADVVITTAQVPGKKAPLLVTAEMVAGMKEGSVIIDIAAEQGGNCALTEAGKEIAKNGVTIVGPLHLPSTLPTHASQMYSKNIASFLGALLTKEGKFNFDFKDEVLSATCVTHEGVVK